MCRIMLNDGTMIHDQYDLLTYLSTIGIEHDSDLKAVYKMMQGIVGIDDRLQAAEDKADEYELIADEYKCNMDGLCDEVRAIADRLISGKRGANYTKEYLGRALLNAVHSYEI